MNQELDQRESDRARWDRKYAAGEGPAHYQPRQLLVEHEHLLCGGRALDVACGFGGNALYLASLGYQVDAVDVSGEGLARARAEALRRGLPVRFVQADLNHWWVPPGRYDAITVFFFLNRALMPQLAAGLRPGGLLFQANRNQHFLAVRPGFDPGYLLEPGELSRLARKAGLEILYQADGIPDAEHTSLIIARRPLTHH
jgi:tellurite methyltransferase